MDERKQRLIDALKHERGLFVLRGQSTREHDLAIKYLETGKTDADPQDFELLDAVMNDCDTMYYDYGV